MHKGEATEPSDGELIRAVRDRREEGAFRLLYRRHTPRLFDFALRMLGGHEFDAEDAVQETWVLACQRLATFRGDAALSTWLIGICLNLCRNVLQKRRRWWETGWEQGPPPETSMNPAWTLAPETSVPENIDLERAIERLPDRCRLVLVLHDVEGWKHREIAAALDVSEGTSKSQLFLARQHMREHLRPTARENHEQAK